MRARCRVSTAATRRPSWSSSTSRGRTLIHTTHSGTQGLAAASGADEVITGALVNAGAIVRYIRSRAARSRDAGSHGARSARALRRRRSVRASCCSRGCVGEQPHVADVRERLRGAASAQKFFDPACDWAPQRDFELCTQVDAFDFVLRLERGRDARAPAANRGDRRWTA